MFELQQGIKSPRDGTVNWQTYEVYDTLKEAKKEAMRYINKGFWRIVKYDSVWSNVE